MKTQGSPLFSTPLDLSRCRYCLGTLLGALICCLCWVSAAQAAEQQPEAPACRFQEIYYKLYIETKPLLCGTNAIRMASAQFPSRAKKMSRSLSQLKTRWSILIRERTWQPCR